MLSLYRPGITLTSLRRQFEALKRKLDRLLAASRLKSATSRIVRLWEIAVEKKKPLPDPVDCVHIMARAGFRPESWNYLHGYIDHCQRFRAVPDAEEILSKLSLPRRLSSLIAVLPDPSPAR